MSKTHMLEKEGLVRWRLPTNYISYMVNVNNRSARLGIRTRHRYSMPESSLTVVCSILGLLIDIC